MTSSGKTSSEPRLPLADPDALKAEIVKLETKLQRQQQNVKQTQTHIETLKYVLEQQIQTY